jgi:plasmid rolling circle replication initiator protein Rep
MNKTGGQEQKMYGEAVSLVDMTASGKERPWKVKKIANERLASVYTEVDEKKAERLKECCEYLHFRIYEDGTKKLDRMSNCRVRLCPICNWRRSLKVYANMTKIMDGLESDNLAFLFLTLTVENCKGEQLSETIDNMMYGWKKLTLNKAFKKIVKGTYRGMEVTHNINPMSTWYDTYHPHFHCVIAVKPSYFKSKDYISHEKWVAMWKQAMAIEYEPIVDVRRVKGTTAKAVAEMAGYAVKEDDYIIPEDWELTIRTVKILDQALAKRRFVSYGGVMRDMHKKLNLDDEEKGDLVNIGDDEKERDKDYKLQAYRWFTGYNQYYAIE